MSLIEHRGKILVVVIVVIAAALYLGNNWINKKEEGAKEFARGVSRQAQDHHVSQLKKMVEDGGGTYHDGIGITPAARVGAVLLKGGGMSKDALLVIELNIMNVMPDRRTISYRTWPATDFAPGGNASLTDNHGKRYGRAEPANMALTDFTVKSASVKYGDSVKDELAFEPPAGEIEYLDLRLPATNVGGEGVIEIRIPGDAIKRRQ